MNVVSELIIFSIETVFRDAVFESASANSLMYWITSWSGTYKNNKLSLYVWFAICDICCVGEINEILQQAINFIICFSWVPVHAKCILLYFYLSSFNPQVFSVQLEINQNLHFFFNEVFQWKTFTSTSKLLS
jgi:hypothetical protein